MFKKETKLSFGKLSYIENGLGQTVVLLHGLGATKEMWLESMQLLPEYHCISVDFPGFGDSEKPAVNYNISYLTDSIIEFCNIKQLSNVILCGASMGARVALEIALLKPDLIRGLILADCGGLSPLGRGLPAKPFLKEILVFFLTNSKLFLRVFLSKTIFYQDIITDEMLVDYQSRLKQVGAKKAFLQMATELAVVKGDLQERLKVINLPTLIIWGQYDKTFPLKDGEIFAREISGADLVVIPESGHVPAMEAPIPFSETVKDFLKKLN